MRILIAAHKERGAACLKALQTGGHALVGCILHAGSLSANQKNASALEAERMKIPVFDPEDVHDAAVLKQLRALKPEVILLAGYGPIVKKAFMEIAPNGCFNLHGGKLPESRGSSPMNWALINGEKSFSICVIKVDEGIDSGDIVATRTFPIEVNDTIRELHQKVNRAFPEMALEVMNKLAAHTLTYQKQNESFSGYYPLRFPQDGLILWDKFTAEQVHNRIRALTTPYPGAYTYFDSRKYKLLSSRLTDRPFYGEPGRVYKIDKQKLLICCVDRCVWIEEAIAEEDGEPLSKRVKRYDSLPTVKAMYEAFCQGQAVALS